MTYRGAGGCLTIKMLNNKKFNNSNKQTSTTSNKWEEKRVPTVNLFNGGVIARRGSLTVKALT